jgi:hydrogenase maturation protease
VSRIRIIGIGSPSGDDQAGWLTIDALLDNGLGAGGAIAIEKQDRPGANLVSSLQGADWVILVDAMQGEGQAGRIQRFDRTDWPGYGHGLSSHGLGVLDALALAQALGCLPPRLDLYGIEIGSVNPDEGAGETIHVAARQLSTLITDELDSAA